MQLTIVPRENLVVIDRRAARIDLSGRKEFNDIHAVKWDDADGYGSIEYLNDTTLPVHNMRMFRGTERITDLAPYQEFIDAHQKAVAAQDAEFKRGERK